MWMGIFLNPKRECLQIQKYPDMCGTSLNILLPCLDDVIFC